MMPDTRPVITHAIPDELKQRRQWVAWKIFQRAGKPTKVPINPDMGSFAEVDAPSTWGTIEAALARYRRDRLAGIGYVLSPMDPFSFVDIDRCRAETGAIDADVQVIVTMLDSYSEISPSGTGVHVVVKANLPGNRNRIGTVETYDQLRFFTITGHRLPDTPATINERQPQLDRLYRQLFGDPEARPAPVLSPMGETTLPGDALWQWAYPRLSARMMRVANLDDSEYAGDASRADEGLTCALMALGLTRSEVDAAFRASPRAAGLATRKGENRLDYLIERATTRAAAFIGEGKVL